MRTRTVLASVSHADGNQQAANANRSNAEQFEYLRTLMSLLVSAHSGLRHRLTVLEWNGVRIGDRASQR
jgi:hypothetical protein